MKKKKIIILSLVLIFAILAVFYAIYFFTYFKPGKFGDLELKEDKTFTLKGCDFTEGFYEVDNGKIYLYLTDEPTKTIIFVLDIVNVNKLKITANGTNCPQYENAIYIRS